MAQATEVRRASRPPAESVREAPFALVRDTTADGEPNDGLTLDGYGAVFNSLTTIDSWEGRFREQIAPGSMKRSFRETPPKIQFDHGRHPMIGSIPIAELRSISEDTDPMLAPNGGAHVIGRVFDNWLMQPVRDAISVGAIDGMSFRFEVVREAWQTADGTPIRDDNELMSILDQAWLGNWPDEELPIRTLRELKVPEIGPVTWPAYMDTSVGMRSRVIDLGRLADPSQRKLLAEAVFAADRAESGTGTDTGPGMGQTDSDDDPAALASALESILDQACELMAAMDVSGMPPEMAQVCAMMTAAETTADALLEAMGITDPDDDDEPSDPAAGRSKDVDTQRPAPVGKRRPTITDAQRDTTTEVVVERPSSTKDAQRSTGGKKSLPPVGEHPSTPRRFSDKRLQLMNQRDRLLNLRSIGERAR